MVIEVRERPLMALKKHAQALDQQTTGSVDSLVADLVSQMTLAEKIGQMCQIDAGGAATDPEIIARVRSGSIGSIINLVDPDQIVRLQEAAKHESRMGIPLLVARDVIHGFETVFPIPLGQAASWDPALVGKAAQIAAAEAASVGVNWTFAPMLDVARDGRWGRIAESFGEDPLLTSIFGAAMIEGFQGQDLCQPGRIAACAKHFVGYGASEGGRDYSTTNIPDNEMHNTYLPPFKAALQAGAASVMSSFSDLDGIPATAHTGLLRDLLRDSWGFDGVVISDWNAVHELVIHGFAENDLEAAAAAIEAGVDIEMNGPAYPGSIPALLAEGRIDLDQIDTMVARILKLKAALGLFELAPDAFVHRTNPPVDPLTTSHALARKSIVLLKNQDSILPLKADTIGSIAVLGPLSDAPEEQLGTWVFDGDAGISVTPLQALRSFGAGRFDVSHMPVLQTTRDRDTTGFEQARLLVRKSDVAIVCIGEDAILSGEAHSRARLDLPGAQLGLLEAIKSEGKPVIAIVMAGRPLDLSEVLPLVDGLFYAWHPGTMAGPALVDLLFGACSPSGRLPVSFPRSVGQIPIHYNRKNTGRPPSEETVLLIDDIPADARQTSFGMTAFHLDDGYTPLFPFGFGLSYGSFEYGPVMTSASAFGKGESLIASATVTNVGNHAATETVQLYIRDLVGSVTRPVRELKGFRQIELQAGEATTVTFTITADDLTFYTRDKQIRAEAGEFHIWIGPHAQAGTPEAFRLLPDLVI
jgi:beta-glucosidase